MRITAHRQQSTPCGLIEMKARANHLGNGFLSLMSLTAGWLEKIAIVIWSPGNSATPFNP